MTLLSLHAVTLGFGGPDLLEGVDFHVERGERLCLVGRNGEGKTTLLRVLEGRIAPDDGEVRRSDGLTLATLPQALPERMNDSVFDVVAGAMGKAGELAARRRVALRDGDEPQAERLQAALNDLEAWDVERVIAAAVADTGLDPDAPMHALSGGQMRRALLARAMAAEPSLLILDEPTNHLDIASIEALEEALLAWRGAIIFTTHDRAFLRRLATRIVELDRGQLTSWPGDYDNYLRRREERASAEAIERAHQDRKLAEEEQWIRKGIQARRTRNEGRVRALHKLREQHASRRAEARRAGFGVETAARSGRQVMIAENVTHAFDDQVVIRDFSTIVLRGDKVGIVGPNGAGKTTLIRLLLGELAPTQGTVEIGTQLEVAYFDQRRAQLDDDATVFEWVAQGSDKVEAGGGTRHVMSYLADFLFGPDRARGPISALSGGERNRLMLARLFAKPSNLLVLDEPTNDLDVETLELLEEQLAQYTGTVLLASHDRAFLDNTVTNTLVFEGGGRVVDHAGGHADWRAHVQRTDRPVAAPKPAPPPGEAPAAKAGGGARPNRPRKLSYKETRELETLPADIEALEASLETQRAELADPELYRREGAAVAERVSALEAAEAKLAAMYERWDELEALANP